MSYEIKELTAMSSADPEEVTAINKMTTCVQTYTTT